MIDFYNFFGVDFEALTPIEVRNQLEIDFQTINDKGEFKNLQSKVQEGDEYNIMKQSIEYRIQDLKDDPNFKRQFLTTVEKITQMTGNDYRDWLQGKINGLEFVQRVSKYIITSHLAVCAAVGVVVGAGFCAAIGLGGTIGLCFGLPGWIIGGIVGGLLGVTAGYLLDKKWTENQNEQIYPEQAYTKALTFFDLGQDSTQQEVNKLYKANLIAFHPDKCSDELKEIFTKKFQKSMMCYEIIKAYRIHKNQWKMD